MQGEGVKEAQKRAAPNRVPDTVENKQKKEAWGEKRHCDPCWWDEAGREKPLEQAGLGV